MAFRSTAHRRRGVEEKAEDALPAVESQGGYHGPGSKYPRKYVQGPLRNAYFRHITRSSETEYMTTCTQLGAEMNSAILARLKTVGTTPIPKNKILGGEKISLRDTYVGERGFLCLLPFLDQNTTWTELDASNNGLRNEAVIHLVDLLMQPQHANRVYKLNLSSNPISSTAAYALMDLVRHHPKGIDEIDLRLTKVPKRLAFMVRGMVSARGAGAEAAAAEAAELQARAEAEAERAAAAAEKALEEAQLAKAALAEAAAIRAAAEERAAVALAAEAAAAHGGPLHVDDEEARAATGSASAPVAAEAAAEAEPAAQEAEVEQAMEGAEAHAASDPSAAEAPVAPEAHEAAQEAEVARAAEAEVHLQDSTDGTGSEAEAASRGSS